MEEQLITYKTGILALSKGFKFTHIIEERRDNICQVYNDEGYLCTEINYEPDFDAGEDSDIPASTQTFLQEWLRKEHGIHIEILLEEDAPYNKFYYRIMRIGNYFTLSHDGIYYKTPEETLEAGLVEALESIKSK